MNPDGGADDLGRQLIDFLDGLHGLTPFMIPVLSVLSVASV
jgi:hypothetical protein